VDAAPAASPDAARSIDAGVVTPPTPTSDGCGCQTTRHDGSAPFWLALVGLFVAARSRRRAGPR
jgi:MYXO-CTERM domain-containing protein